MDNKRIVIYGGGTVAHIASHLAIAAPAYGKTAKLMAELCREIMPNLDVDLRLTKMAGGKTLETNQDIQTDLEKVIKDDITKIIIMSAALCDFEPTRIAENYPEKSHCHAIEKKLDNKYTTRLKTRNIIDIDVNLKPADKIINLIRKTRKDIFLVGFKTTCGETEDNQYISGLRLCKEASCNLVFANDVRTRVNMVITPEEARYHVTVNREEALRGMLEMACARSHLTFTRSTVIAGNPVPWNSELIPPSLRTVVDYCIDKGAYKEFNGATVGHFACKLSDTEFLTSIRKTNFNNLKDIGLVRVVTDGPDTVLAYGAKPSVGGQSQRIIFHDHDGMDCVVHFHCEQKLDSKVPVVSQRLVECGSHSCGERTSNGLKQFGNLKAVYLDNHGPNIIFNRTIDPQEVIKFIENNFDLNTKTGGFVSAK